MVGSGRGGRAGSNSPLFVKIGEIVWGTPRGVLFLVELC